jgi:hypothetical protein
MIEAVLSIFNIDDAKFAEAALQLTIEKHAASRSMSAGKRVAWQKQVGS